MKIKAVVFPIAMLLCAGVRCQQTEKSQQPPSKTDELVKNLSPEDRAALLKSLQQSAAQAQQPTGDTTVAPPPKALDDLKPHRTEPPKPKTPAGCEASQAVGTAARVGASVGRKVRVFVIQRTGVDLIGEAAAAAQTPCKPAAPAKDQQAGK